MPNRRRSRKYCSIQCFNRQRPKGRRWPHLDATQTPTREEIILAAGWFEGEGNARSATGCEAASVAQKDRWMLEKLRAWFGGSISIQTKKSGRYAGHICYAWRVCGGRARSFLAIVYPYLSPWRQQQIRRVFLASKSKLVVDGQEVQL
jgi:hypothetical protein